MRLFAGYLIALCFWLAFGAMAAGVSQAQYGATDASSEKLIELINRRSILRSGKKYPELIANLETSASQYKVGSYGKSRLLNELADLYSYHLFDIEKAIKIDQELLSGAIPDFDLAMDFVPQHEVANNRIISDKNYYQSYVKIAATEIAETANGRLKANLSLLEGVGEYTKKKYSFEFLKEHIARVRKDADTGRVSQVDKKSIFSRLLRADYELNLLDSKYEVTEFNRLISGELLLSDVDFSEIDYLQLASYLMTAYIRSGDIRLPEMALDVVYKPYANLRSFSARWKYNKIINSYISTLIDANYSAGRFDELLYYANLNKSRMLLEERLAYGAGNVADAKISDLVADDSIPRTAGLPDKAWFKRKLADTSQFLDFYVGGTYVAQNVAGATSLSKAERSVMPFTSRNSTRVNAVNEPTEVFKDDALYITQVVNGRASAVKLAGAELAALRGEMEKSYAAIADNQKAVASTTLQKIKTRLQSADNLTISPDKWISTHPLDFHMQAKAVRSVNFFTSGASGKLDRLSVAGFFNPTLDLRGADAEADVIKALLPQATIIRREAARKSALGTVSGANVIHLSMHGAFNDSDPTQSKLVFAGAANDDSTGDPNALYATEMSQVAALRNRDLVFAAACQTGLQAADRTNISELTGILRPLTANRNKNLILSLWNVSDEATGEFVKAFYQQLALTQDVKAAFYYAQDQLRAKYPNPYYWAAFYLSQAS